MVLAGDDRDRRDGVVQHGVRGSRERGTGPTGAPPPAPYDPHVPAGDSVFAALLGVARGEAVLGPRIAQRVLSHFAAPPPAVRTALPFPHLTDCERETLDLISRGLDNASIARRLNLSEKTVRNRVGDVLAKLHARSRTEAAALARDAGPGHPRPSGQERTRLNGPAGPGSSP
ncbi:helix-turn-helix transcriptional regulator [Streptomyces dubilierae]|uniref:Response regulator transcription factor n=1 Tax=Streptomyces dubilierae TaxID=3075533 RepID=A0ABU2P2E8_9ACTN|nr:response regulator transcription factor [Streptomyces sp. DSM 41921]MDT0386316.1 response regulator transcription factor [Streptomyces sp. DSM 41921]